MQRSENSQDYLKYIYPPINIYILQKDSYMEYIKNMNIQWEYDKLHHRKVVGERLKDFMKKNIQVTNK